MRKLALGLILLLPSSVAAKTVTGRASFDRHTGAMVTAARGVRRGSVLYAWNPETGKGARVRVTDACGRSMRFRHGRVLDLSTGAFRAIYGSLRRGHGPISYRVVSKGHGAYCGSF